MTNLDGRWCEWMFARRMWPHLRFVRALHRIRGHQLHLIHWKHTDQWACDTCRLLLDHVITARQDEERIPA
jgi:hypothetical protein